MGVFGIKGWRVLVTLVSCGLIAGGPLTSSLRPWEVPWGAPEAGVKRLTAEAATVDNAGAIPMKVTAQAPPAIIRPSAYDNSGFGSPQNAINKNLADASGGTWSRNCSSQATCGSTTAQCTWRTFPAGYVPLELKVTWNSNGGISTRTDFEAMIVWTIEYSLDGGGSWMTMDSRTCVAAGPDGCPSDTRTPSIQLMPSQRTDLVQVRAKVTVSILMCPNNQCNTSGDVAGSISVYDVQIVAQRPAFQVFLDVDGNFNPANPQSDLDDYVPGSNLDGTSVPVSVLSGYPNGGQPLTLIAAYVLPNRQLAKPADFKESTESSTVTYPARSSANTSQFKGVAMNYKIGLGGELDFYMPTIFRGFADDNGLTSRVPLKCFDYGGFTTVTATSGPDTTTLRIPKDNNGNWLPDGGWKLFANGQQYGAIEDTGLAKQDDQDTNPNPSSVSIGDGFSNFEEFRGFIVRDEHRRTNPYMKDLFIGVVTDPGQIPEQDNIGCAVNLPLTKHRINATGQTDANLQVNFNRSNSGYGGPIPGPSPLQRSLIVINGGYSATYYGYTFPLSSQYTPPLVPNEVARCEVYIDTIRECSPGNFNRVDEDPYDHNAIKHVTGHEVGHGIHISHYDVCCPEPPVELVTAMANRWLRCQPLDSMGNPDMNDYTWTHIPCNYNDNDKDQIWLRRP